MTITEIMIKMIEQLDGNVKDINHMLKVYTYAKTIGEGEQLNQKDQFTLEATAILHDIAIPLCRKKYGDACGKNQEKESALLVREFFQGFTVPEDIVERVTFLVSHHHTYTGVDGKDYQILLEADYLVNADESSYSRENICNTKEKVFKTETGINLLKTIYGVN